MTHLRQTLVLIGHGTVGHRFVQAAIERGLTSAGTFSCSPRNRIRPQGRPGSCLLPRHRRARRDPGRRSLPHDEAIFVGPKTRYMTSEHWKSPGQRIPTQLGCWSLKMLNSKRW